MGEGEVFNRGRESIFETTGDFQDFDDFDYSQGVKFKDGEEQFLLEDFSDDDFSDDFDDFSDDRDFDDDLSRGFNTNPITNINVIQSKKISESETELDVSVNDLLNGVLVSDVQEDDEDYEDFLVLKSSLEAAGYSNLNNCDFEDLCKIQKRQQFIEQSGVTDAFRLEVVDTLKRCREELAASSSTLAERDSYRDNDYMRNNTSGSFGNEVLIAATNIASELNGKGIEVTAETIFDRFVSSGGMAAIPDDSQDSLLAYLEQLIPIIKEYNDETSYQESLQRQARERMAKLLTRDELQSISSLVSQSSSIDYVKNVNVISNGLAVECPSCKAHQIIKNAPIDIILFSSELKSANSALRYCLPIPIKCDSCGSILIFTKDEYNSMESRTQEEYKISKNSRSKASVMSSALQQVETLCNGASVLKIRPSAHSVIPALTDIIRDDTDEIEETFSNAESETSTGSSIIFDDMEFREAVKRFYSYLDSFDSQQSYVRGQQDSSSQSEYYQSDRQSNLALTYRQLAAYFVDMLSLDYVKVKNKALFSLIFYLTENPLFKENLDCSVLWSAEADFELIGGLTKKTIPKLSGLKKTLLVNLSALLRTQAGIESDYSKTEDEIIEDLFDMMPDILCLVQDNIRKYQEAIKFLNENEEALGYCKIMNLSNCRLAEFDRYVGSSVVMDLFDRITDRMIISNYAGDFYERWSLFNVMNISTLRKYLTVGARQNQALKYIVDKVGEIVKPYGVTTNTVKYFLSPVVDSIIDIHAQLRDVCGYYRAVNFYKFCKGVINISGDFESYVSMNLSAKLKQAINSVKKKCADVVKVKEYEYYLSDFSHEELAMCGEDLELFTFGRWIPKRLKGENISEYVKRYTEFQNKNLYDCINSYDFLRKFQEIREEVYIISVASIYSGIEYSSYSTSVFMERTIGLVNMCGDKRLMYNFLNSSEELMNMIFSRTEFLDTKGLECNLTTEFNHVLERYYFTSVSEYVDKIKSKYDGIMLFDDESLNKSLTRNSKIDMLEQLATFISNSEKEVHDDGFSSVEEMMEELLDSVESNEIRIAIGGSNVISTT